MRRCVCSEGVCSSQRSLRRLDQREGFSGGKDRDALERLQVSQAVVPRDHEIGLRSQRAGEHLIIVRIARHLWRDFGRNHDSCEPGIVRYERNRG